jgi:hypothetical protein
MQAELYGDAHQYPDETGDDATYHGVKPLQLPHPLMLVGEKKHRKGAWGEDRQ